LTIKHKFKEFSFFKSCLVTYLIAKLDARVKKHIKKARRKNETKQVSTMSKSTQAIKEAFNLCLKQPILFLPALAPIIIQVIFQALSNVFAVTITEPGYIIGGVTFPGYSYSVANPWLAWGGSFLAAIVGFVAICMIVDMANDVSKGKTANLNKSLSYVMGKLGTLIIAAIIAGICIFTVILIPVGLFIAVIAIIEGTDAIESTKRSFSFFKRYIAEIIVFLILIIIISAILGFGFGLIPVVGPYLGSILSWGLNVVWTAAALSFYLSLRGNLQSIPPPPPPPPPPEH